MKLFLAVFKIIIQMWFMGFQKYNVTKIKKLFIKHLNCYVILFAITQ